MIRRMLPALVAACFIAPTLHQGASSAQAAVAVPAQAPTLKITPDKGYVGGQALQWTGNIGVTGARTITMEKYLGRAGDDWEAVPYFSSKTDAAGNFSYTYPAPAMQSIQYRVAAGSYKTPHVVLDAVQPDLILWVTGADRDDPQDIGNAIAGESFGISVDTTPALPRRPDTEGSQPIPGRQLTLQRRVAGDEWVTLGTTTVDKNGMGYLTDVRETEPGDVVYRVRAENWFKGDNKIGWFPSFPTYIKISAKGVAADPAIDAPAVSAVPNTAEVAPLLPDDTDAFGPDALGGTASQKYGWPAPYFDFAWVQGESLTSPPYRGTRQQGWWLDYSDGGGRLNKDGGGLLLDSKRLNDSGPGDFGTTMGTLQDNPITYGRWEAKLNVSALENSDDDYAARLELVPDRAQNDGCQTITVAELTDHGKTLAFGVNAVDTQWNGSYQVGAVDHATFSVAAEVTTGHITWFVDSKPIGTVNDENAIPGVPMTLRISMVGDGDNEMNRTEVKSDWQRGFSLAKGEEVTNGAPLTKNALGNC